MAISIIYNCCVYGEKCGNALEHQKVEVYSMSWKNLVNRSSSASELILEWGGVEEARPEGLREGDGVLGEGTASPSPSTRGFAGVL